MTFGILLLFIFVAGLAGGLVNALLSADGLILPSKAQTGTAGTVIRPGVLGTMFIGGVAACLSWGLYGPFVDYNILSSGKLGAEAPSLSMTLSEIAGAVLVGIAGARWLTNEVDKRLLRAAASAAAAAKGDAAKARRIAFASPAEALRTALE